MSEAGEGTKFGDNSVDGTGCLGVKRRLERASEVLAMEEMLTKGIQRAATEGAGLVLEGWRQRGEQQVGLEDEVLERDMLVKQMDVCG